MDIKLTWSCRQCTDTNNNAPIHRSDFVRCFEIWSMILSHVEFLSRLFEPNCAKMPRMCSTKPLPLDVLQVTFQVAPFSCWGHMKIWKWKNNGVTGKPRSLPAAIARWKTSISPVDQRVGRLFNTGPITRDVDMTECIVIYYPDFGVRAESGKFGQDNMRLFWWHRFEVRW